MKTIWCVVFALLLLALPAGILAGETQLDVVQLHSGPVRGKAEGSVRVFLGIPYAAPPVASLRWRSPQEVASWAEVRKSTEFGDLYKKECDFISGQSIYRSE